MKKLIFVLFFLIFSSTITLASARTDKQIPYYLSSALIGLDDLSDDELYCTSGSVYIERYDYRITCVRCSSVSLEHAQILVADCLMDAIIRNELSDD